MQGRKKNRTGLVKITWVLTVFSLFSVSVKIFSGLACSVPVPFFGLKGARTERLMRLLAEGSRLSP